MSYDARQRYRRHKRDPLRGAQIAPAHPQPSVRCATCLHLRLRHEFVELDLSLACLVDGCECMSYEEAS